MSDRPSYDVLLSLAGWHNAELDTIRHAAKRLDRLGYRIVSADDAAKLDRLRECSRTVSDGGGYGDGRNDLLDQLNGDGER